MAVATSGRVDVGRWSPARIYLVVAAVFLFTSAIVGFGLNAAFPTSAGEVHSAGSGHILGIFETNGWHNLAAVISGSLNVGFALRPEWSRFGALFKGVFYTIVTASIAIFGADTFLIASNTADQIVHGSMAFFGLATGLATRRS